MPGRGGGEKWVNDAAFRAKFTPECVCGYFRPVSNWNRGKKQEFKNRKTFKIPETINPKKKEK